MRVALYARAGCPCKRQKRRDTDPAEKPHGDGGGDGRDVAAGPGPLEPTEESHPCPAWTSGSGGG